MKQRDKSRADLAAARALFDQGRVPLPVIASTLGLTERGFRTLRQREGWPQRPKVPKPVAQPAAADDERDATAPLKARLDAAIRREIRRIERDGGKETPPGAERKARILASLVKTLADLRRLDPPGRRKTEAGDDENHGDTPRETPRDMAALRRALVERLAELRGERDAG